MRRLVTGLEEMPPRFHPFLVNDPLGDAGLYIELMFEKRALLFDLGDLSPLSSRKLLRISDAFVSHMHMDHFCGFDRLLRMDLGREVRLRLYGPSGLIEAVGHRLASYTWNLVRTYDTEFAIVVHELVTPDQVRSVEFHTSDAFRPTEPRTGAIDNGILLDEPSFRVRTAMLDHGITCLGFALEEHAHINVWKTRLEALGLATGPWLRSLKEAVLRDEPDTTSIPVVWKDSSHANPAALPLGRLRSEVLRTVPGRKIAYVVDTVFTPRNVSRIVDLVSDADILFIESPFLDADRDRARDRKHLTARQAGLIAREAGVKRMVPFHFSPRYDDISALESEALAAFEHGPDGDGSDLVQA